MPECNGFDGIRKIKSYVSEHNDLRQPYTCLLSCNDSENCKKKAAEIGIDVVIKKPIFKAGIQKLLLNAGIIED